MLQYFFVPELLPQDEVEISFIYELLSHFLSLRVGLKITRVFHIQVIPISVKESRCICKRKHLSYFCTIPNYYFINRMVAKPSPFIYVLILAAIFSIFPVIFSFNKYIHQILVNIF